MRIVVVGASGNVGSALLRRMRRERDVEIVGVARRLPPRGAGEPYDGVRWHSCDIGLAGATDELSGVFAGADVVVHLAWQIQPSHDQHVLRRTNVGGSRAVVDAVLRARVPALVYASSVGAYAPGPKDAPVSERWPVTGVPESSYSRDKATVEEMLDGIERSHPALRLVRMRPGLIFQREAGTEIVRYFLGPLAPVRLLRFGRLPLVPTNRRLRMQVVHADDVADAYARAIMGDARGAFNVAADPVLTPELVARHFHGWTVPVAAPVLRVAAALTWRARLQPVDAGWVELALNAPLMSSERAENELGWSQTVDSVSALRELFGGMADGAQAPSPALSTAPTFPTGQGNPH